jgi:hypothetical protein
MKKLAQLLGILATVTNDDMAEIDVDRKKKADRLKKAKKLKRLISAASTILKGTVVAYAIGVSIDAVTGALIDIASSDDEIVPENIVKVLVNNFIESATFGAVKGPFETGSTASEVKTEAAPVPSSTPAAPAPNDNWNTDPNVIEVTPTEAKETKKEKLQDNKPTPKKPEPVRKESPVSSLTPAAKEEPQTESVVNLMPDSILASGVKGTEINNLSNIVNEYEESIIRNNLILVNNSTTVYQNTQQSRLYPSLAYSGSVGL